MQGSGASLAATSPDGLPLATHSTSAHYSRQYAALRAQYSGTPLDVSFREIVGPLPANEYTHGLYPYPARLIRHIPRFLLATDALTDGIDLIFDPFAGSGTVLLEAKLRGIDSIGIEQNPVAALVSRVKIRDDGGAGVADLLDQTGREARKSRRTSIPSRSLTRWYSAQALSVLGRLTARLANTANPDRDVVSLCIALSARRLACTDPRIPVPVRTQRNASITTSEAWHAWDLAAESICSKLSSVSKHSAVASVVQADAREVASWPSPQRGASTLLLSSPPYGAAQKYVRSTSLEAAWLGHAPSGRTVQIEHGSIGREHLSKRDESLTVNQLWSGRLQEEVAEIGAINSRRGAIYLAYFNDMQGVFSNAYNRRIKRIALISGTNTVVGRSIQTSRHLADMLIELGYSRSISMRDPIRGRTLLTNRKNGTPSPAEYIDVFEATHV